jgi:hypothetical protein
LKLSGTWDTYLTGTFIYYFNVICGTVLKIVARAGEGAFTGEQGCTNAGQANFTRTSI